jgi:DNA ligase-1
MPDLDDGETIEVQGSGSKPYVIRNVGGVYSCSCPAWRNQSITIEQRTCKHIRRLRGEEAEQARIGSALPAKPKSADGEDDSKAPPLLLAESWDSATDLSGWWMSEKLDGVRAFWDGKQFISRLGNLYHAPDWFLETLPSTPLDGELWIDRKAFQRTVSVVKRQDKSDLWKEIKFLVFDAPAQKDPFEDRLKFLKETFTTFQSPYVLLHEMNLCRNLDHLRQELEAVEKLGGEGLMLREPGSKYVAGRSSTLLKVKTFKDDEAEVIGHQPGTGRHKGRLGALLVRLSNGIEFAVGTGFSDKERESPSPIGSTITFRYQELSDRGVPRFPSYVRFRADSVAPPAKTIAPPKKSPQPIAVASTPTPPATSATPSPKRYFEFVEGNSSKFWEVSVEGANLTTRWGKIGTDGQTKIKPFAAATKAEAEMQKLIEEKTEKGYEEK